MNEDEDLSARSESRPVPAEAAETEALGASALLKHRLGALTSEAGVGTELPPPTQIGPYRIMELLGVGGFGEVYKAEQRSPIRRTVAVKIIKLGFDTREVIARFESERQALTRMDHPHITRMLDAGKT